MSNFKAGDTVRCIRAQNRSKLTLGAEYVVKSCGPSYTAVEGVPGCFYNSRFELVTKAKAKAKGKGKSAPFGQVRSVTVNMSDIHDVLTQYVRFGLGINATVEKIIDKFPEAVELVLKHEVAA
jgi:hypothetical protein